MAEPATKLRRGRYLFHPEIECRAKHALHLAALGDDALVTAPETLHEREVGLGCPDDVPKNDIGCRHRQSHPSVATANGGQITGTGQSVHDLHQMRTRDVVRV